MIQGFEEQTEPLTEYEENKLLPPIVRGLMTKVGKEKAVTNSDIVNGLRNNLHLSLTGARVRKIINHIRTHDIVPCLIATSNGYYNFANMKTPCSGAKRPSVRCVSPYSANA